MSDSNKLSRFRIGSYNINVDRHFVNKTVAEAVDCLADYAGGKMYIDVHDPPYTSVPQIGKTQIIPGHLSVSFSQENRDTDIDILFSYYADGEFQREPLSESGKSALRENECGSCWLTSHNFTEAWQIIVLLGEKLDISKIAISCGAA